MSTLENAISLAALKHAGQKDKAGEPYILHPLHVMSKMTTEDERIVAVLHDIIEDTDVTVSDLLERGFSVRVVEAIEYLTRVDGQSYDDFIRKVCENPLAKKVKVEDIFHNLNMSRIPNITQKDIERTVKYSKALAILYGEE